VDSTLRFPYWDNIIQQRQQEPPLLPAIPHKPQPTTRLPILCDRPSVLPTHKNAVYVEAVYNFPAEYPGELSLEVS